MRPPQGLLDHDWASLDAPRLFIRRTDASLPRMAGPAHATTDPDVDDIDSAAAQFGVGLALMVGGIVRILPMLGTDFPLNDGGLFGIMIQDLVDAGFLLPASTSYNGLNIPFAYPPLGFYVAGIGQQVFGLSIPETLRAVPLMVNLATIPAVYWLASAVLRSRSGGTLAALAFALLPRSYLVLITGGGITRGLGLLLAIIALGLAWRLLQSRDHRWWAVTVLGLDGGLTALAHPQAAVFQATSIVVFLPWAIDKREAVVRVAVSGAVGLVVLSTWLIPVIAVHGAQPLISAMESGQSGPEGLAQLLSLRFAELAVFDVITVAALIGTILAIRRRALMLPIWLVAIWLVDSRAGFTFAMIPLSLLAGYALLSLTPSWLPTRGSRPLRSIRNHPVRAAVIVLVLGGLVLANYYSGLRPASPLHALSTEHLQAMTWVGDHAPDEAEFAVVTDGAFWEDDATSEWFPALTDRRSAATVQGYEWLGNEAWQRQQDVYYDLQGCARDVLPCVVAWAERYDQPITHVFLPKGELHGSLGAEDCCPAPRHSVELVPGASVIYDGPGATVIQLP
jgi:uncharacterized membrane protein